MQSQKVFFATFIIIGFAMKIMAEFVHEVLGHSLFVVLFGGEITNVYISVLWPYKSSYVFWDLLNATPFQLAWIYSSGIVVCLVLSFLIQAFLILKGGLHFHFEIAFFWLSFWTFLSSSGYLFIGGLAPFGDVEALIDLGVLSGTFFILLGLVVFAFGFVLLSVALWRILFEVFSVDKARLGVAVFWLIIPFLVAVMAVSPEGNLDSAYLPLAFVPALASFLMERFVFASKHEVDACPDYV
ncbi:MAG: hypothetical protein QXL54_05310, partial [Candidatus Bathyarchaeia archaeon]